MEQRIQFSNGEQREFLDLVVKQLNCFSVRGLLQFGFEVNYSSLKNYYSGRRLIPKDLFDEFCHVAKINKNKLHFEIINGNWGQVKGGRIGKK